MAKIHESIEILGKLKKKTTAQASPKVTKEVPLTFICPCIANIFAEYNQRDTTFHNLFISLERSTCFRWFFRPSSEAQNCTYSFRYLSDQTAAG